ncbi:MAG TPA: hypothetical protein VHH55_06455 [Gaiellaceae bacterium]|jgi:hypothetical protein|nr:hypothetical protein [Gaiellaceae bacterium]
MRRKKRLTIIRTGLALAALAIPATAEAKPLPSDQSKTQYQVQNEIPYLSHGRGVDHSQFGGTMGVDDRAVSRVSVQPGPQLEIPYLSHGRGVTPAELGIVSATTSPDDRSFSRGAVETPVTTDEGWSIGVDPYVSTGFGLAALLLAGGIALAIRQSRRDRLAPA